MAVTGIHALLYSPRADELRAALRDVLELDHVDSGDGWLIFALPPAELGVHPGDQPSHELSVMCEDLQATMDELAAKGLEFRGEPSDMGFGVGLPMVLPGGVEMLLYEPRHETAIADR